MTSCRSWRHIGTKDSARAAVAAICALALVIPPASAEVHPVLSDRGMVVASEPVAVDVGTAILSQGGNAFDAAVAVGFALAVTHPMAGNLGGGGFCVATTADGGAFALDFRETAPAAAHRDLYLDSDGEVIPGASTRTHLAVGVPGSVDGLLRLLERHGTMSRGRVLTPAISLARDGIEVTPFLSESLAGKRGLMESHPASTALFFPGGEPLAPGGRFVQPDLAATLERIAAEGREGFYAGETARLLVDAMEKNGGIITAADLERYELLRFD